MSISIRQTVIAQREQLVSLFGQQYLDDMEAMNVASGIGKYNGIEGGTAWWSMPGDERAAIQERMMRELDEAGWTELARLSSVASGIPVEVMAVVYLPENRESIIAASTEMARNGLGEVEASIAELF